MIMTTLSSDVLTKLQSAKLFAMDVDGVLTNGQIIYDANGIETKAFFVQDGVGIKALKNIGMTLAIITGRTSDIVKKRADELGIDYVIQGRDDKLRALQTLADSLNIALVDCIYMGDDLPDVGAIFYAGVGIGVANACDEVKQFADIVTQKSGGAGAVREACMMILKAKGDYDAFLAQFIDVNIIDTKNS